MITARIQTLTRKELKRSSFKCWCQASWQYSIDFPSHFPQDADVMSFLNSAFELLLRVWAASRDLKMVGLITRVQLKTSLPRLIPTILDFWFVAGFVGEVLVFLAKPPRTYMNLSGELVNCSRKQFPIHLAVHFWLHLWNLNFIEHTHIAGWKLNQRARPIIIDPALYLSKKSDLALTTQRRTLPTSFKLFSGY
ncbi:uncharacterized protein LOC108338284 isoform X2 [Vigna angularis]|uniref:uncharacterized protein LOC108338284 isoform X2 n=1 Tax=Phaseolus angularis TaxID=3914 RepID=UPI0022B34321|nr:uncharacterized protein LOC108338284 isoform X2 [Vigna angularis]